MRIQSQAETFSWRTAAEEPTTLHRGIGFDGRDLDPELAQHLHHVLNAGYGQGEADGLAERLLDHASGQGGLGEHWSTAPRVAQGFSGRGDNRQTPKRHQIRMMVSGEWGGQGLNEEETSLTNQKSPFEKEKWLSPGTPVHVTQVHITKPGAGHWLPLPVTPHDRSA